MSIFILLIAAISILHYVLEGLFLPSCRLKLRYDLFELRDRLRLLKIEKQISEEQFNIVHDSINILIPRPNVLTLSFLNSFNQALKTDEKLRERVKKRRAVIEESDNKKLLEIYKSVNHLYVVSLGMNSCGWTFYIIPVAVAVIAVKSTKDILVKCSTIPQHTADKLFPIIEPSLLEC